ncbi:UNVERIFIED_CONTAM: hypothetical protein Scaly_2702100 [Sesamum calycinum]|uniref:Uncharacterized protein n=1 Tax=Sesamum calycinum TaxID=2727403 RepID=A0AAW2J481_9LAMI
MRNFDLEEEKKKLEEELNFYKFQSGRQLDEVSTVDLHEEQILLDALLTAMFGKDETTSTANSFLEAHSGVEECQKLLKMWTSLKPLTQKVIALAADAKNLEKDKDHLTINLRRAEEEVNVLFEENNILNEENKRLIRLCHREKHISGSGGGSLSGKVSIVRSTSILSVGKRKSSPKLSSPVEKKIDFGNLDPQRQPLSPLQSNSPESRMHKK